MNDLEYNSYFDKIFKEHTKGMEDHNFRHFNSSMGIQIYNKEHYKIEMKKRRMVPYQETERLAEQWDKEHPRKDYELSPKAMDIIRSLKMTADDNGNIQLGSKAVQALKEIGAIKPTSKYIPESMSLSGGFENK